MAMSENTGHGLILTGNRAGRPTITYIHYLWRDGGTVKYALLLLQLKVTNADTDHIVSHNEPTYRGTVALL